MQILTNLLFTLAWWLRKPMLWLVRYRTVPEDLGAGLVLDPKRPVCFVLPERSWADLFVLDRICQERGLPRPHRTGDALPTVSRPGYLYLSVLLEARLKGGRKRAAVVTSLIQQAIENPVYDVQLVPVSMFWGREPDKETSLFKLLFSDAPGAGVIRKFFIILFNGRNLFANFAPPLNFREYLQEEGDGQSTDPKRAMHKLTRALHVHFLRQRTATVGPSLVRRAQVVEQLLGTRAVQIAMERHAKLKGRTLAQVEKKARKIAEEIAADYSNASINFLERVLGYVWNRIFKGIDTRGLERVRAAAQSHVMIYLPAHRSHADYLLASYVLYHAGLMPPHIAAGINLNIPFGVGNLLRRCGAFFMRRKFAGDILYTAIFRAYIDSLIKRGYSIEFFPEGGRSRTGRLLTPKTGLMAMMVESALRQQVRKVMVVPVHIGYDKVWEVGSYQKELRGGQKQKESVQGLLKAVPMLVKSYGRVYLNFAEPISIDEFADTHLPGWREKLKPESEEKPEGFADMVSELAQETMRRINGATVVTPTGLIGVSMLASPQRAAAEADLIEQTGLLVDLLQGSPYGPDQYLPMTDAADILRWSEPIAGLSRITHEWGDLILAEPKAAVRMSYARNNIIHLFAMPSLIANFFRSRYGHNKDFVISGCQMLYPFLASQFFLRWKQEEVGGVVSGWIDVMVRSGFLLRTPEGTLQRPDPTSAAFSRLVTLGRIMGETFERYCLSALLLSEERKLGRLHRTQFEDDCRLFAERMAVLTGRNAPEFFDPALFKVYVATLIEQGLVSENDDKTLEVDSRIDSIAERSMELLSGEAQQTVLQILARKRGTPPAPPQREAA